MSAGCSSQRLQLVSVHMMNLSQKTPWFCPHIYIICCLSKSQVSLSQQNASSCFQSRSQISFSQQEPDLTFTAGARFHFHNRSQISLSQQEPDLSRALLQVQVTKDAFQQLLGKEPKVAAIHAGLECGIIGEKVPGMDAVSYGPTITGAHSPDEQVSRQLLHLQILMQSTLSNKKLCSTAVEWVSLQDCCQMGELVVVVSNE